MYIYSKQTFSRNSAHEKLVTKRIEMEVRNLDEHNNIVNGNMSLLAEKGVQSSVFFQS